MTTPLPPAQVLEAMARAACCDECCMRISGDAICRPEWECPFGDGHKCDSWEAWHRTIAAALRAMLACGWQTVPMMATEEMMEAGVAAWPARHERSTFERTFHTLYNAAIAASPSLLPQDKDTR